MLVSAVAVVAGCATPPVEPTFVDLSGLPPATPVKEAPVMTAASQPTKAQKRINKRAAAGHVTDAVTVFPYEDDRIYQVVTAPGYITALQLEPGELMPGKAAIGNPDPADWIVEKTVAGGPGGPRPIVLIKPGRDGLSTNLVLATNRRTYQLDISSHGRRGMDIVRWSYPATSQPGGTVVVSGETEFSPEAFTTAYSIDLVSGERPVWMPVAVYWTGSKTYVAFPAGIGRIAAPALFAIGGGGATALPFRVKDRFYEIDARVGVAELRQGDVVVRIRSAGA